MAIGVFFLVAPVLHGQSGPSLRSVSGTVTDARREPLKGAVVQLEDESTSAVTTYVTGADGHFDFKRFSTTDDFRLFATFRNQRSRRKELSRFSSRTAPVVRLVIHLR